MSTATIEDVQNIAGMIGILVISYLILGMALWLQFPQPGRQGVPAVTRGVLLLPILYVLGFLLRRGKRR